MKKIQLILLALIGFTYTNAQISQGGRPYAETHTFSTDIPTVTLAMPTEAELNEGGTTINGGIEKTGIIRDINVTLNEKGSWTLLENGDRIWRIAIESKKAVSMTLLYENFYLPEGAKLFLYNEDFTQVIGAFTSFNNHVSGQFSSELIHNDKTYVEYYEPKEVQGKGHFTITSVVHQFKSVPVQIDDYGFDDSGNCEVNINCSEGNNWQDEKRGVARILVVSNSGSGWCSGSLVNNTGLDCAPYFLTAYHCGENSTTSNFNNWIFYFNYEAAGCANPSSEPSTSQSITGCSVLANSADGGSNSSDFLLVELNNNVPTSYNPYYNGWNAVLQNTVSTDGVGIHHPAGDIKKISTYTSNLTTTGWNGSGLQSHYQTYWSSTTNGHGVTEGGSSGSPLFNNNGLIVGTLTGGSSYCSNTSAPDYYGKMSYHWNSNGTPNNRRLDVWLDPVGNGTTTSLAGTNAPCTPPVANDAGIFSIDTPNSDICGVNFTPVVTLRNYGSNTLNSCIITYQLNGGTVNTYNWTGSLTTNATTIVTLNPMVATNGANTLQVSTQSPNGVTDQNTSNDSESFNFNALTGDALPLTQGFEGSFVPNGFLLSNSDNNITWEKTTNASNLGSASMYINAYNYNSTGALDWFVLPNLDFSGVTTGTLSYDYAYTYYSNNGTNYYDTLILAASTDCGNTWYLVTKEGGVDLATVAGGSANDFTPTASQWQNVTLDLNDPFFNNQANVQFAFVFKNGYGNNIYIDNININSVAVSNPPTAAFTASSTSICAGSQVSFTNNSTNSPTSYSWSFPGGTPSSASVANPTVTYSNPGSYNVSLIVSNADGSDTLTQNNYITVNPEPSLNISATNLLCSGNNTGSATVSVTNGLSPYTYVWSGSSSTNATANNLAAGTYSVTVTNSAGCSSTSSTSITSPNPLSLSINTTNDVCNQSVGSATANVSGGTAPYSYAWSGGTNTNLSAGTYSLTVTDANGCNISQNYTINNTSPSYTIVVNTTPSACGQNNGTATATVNGTTTGFTFVYSSGTPTGPNSVGGLGFGNHTVTITDGSGCSQTETFSITNANAPSVVVSTTDVSCFGGSDGTASVTVTGGTAPYSYSWGAGNAIQNLNAGQYTLTVTDASGCMVQANYTIIEPAQLFVNPIVTPEHCGLADGSIQANASGGVTPYTYVWNATTGLATLNNLSEGTYQIQVTDAAGCGASTSAVVNNVAAPEIQLLSYQDVLCHGGSDGAIDVDVIGGSGNITYDWGITNTQDLSNVEAGTYALIIEDAYTCSDTLTQSIGEPSSPLLINLNVTDLSATGGASAVSASVSGGTPPYSYVWNTGDTTQNIQNLAIGEYILSVMDANGCSTSDTAVIGNVAITETEWLAEISLYPNPTSKNITLAYTFNNKQDFITEIYNAIGQRIYHKSMVDAKQGFVHFNMAEKAQGIYFLKLSNDSQSKILRFIKE